MTHETIEKLDVRLDRVVEADEAIWTSIEELQSTLRQIAGRVERTGDVRRLVLGRDEIGGLSRDKDVFGANRDRHRCRANSARKAHKRWLDLLE